MQTLNMQTPETQSLWKTVSRKAILAVVLTGAAAFTLNTSWAQTEPSGEKRPPQPAAEKAAPGPPNAEPAGTGFNDGRKPTQPTDTPAVAAQPPVLGPPLEKGVLSSGTNTSGQDVDTAPAKYSAQNAAADQLPVAAYTFRDLTPEQRRAVFEAVTGGDTAVSAGSATVSATLGSEIPSDIASRQLKPMPAALTAQMPQFGNIRYMRSGDLVLAVAPNNNVVVGVFNKDGSLAPAAVATTAANDPKGANDAPPATAAPGSR
jgi:hypothetical protein